jgi:hypothetical protein
MEMEYTYNEVEQLPALCRLRVLHVGEVHIRRRKLGRRLFGLRLGFWGWRELVLGLLRGGFGVHLLWCRCVFRGDKP